MVKLTSLNRARAVGFVEAGWSSQRVADHFHVSRRTVTNLLRRYRDTGDVK